MQVAVAHIVSATQIFVSNEWGYCINKEVDECIVEVVWLVIKYLTYESDC